MQIPQAASLYEFLGCGYDTHEVMDAVQLGGAWEAG